ncbi:MAG: DNA primase, partial [Firmicutes bacterium]|nr:DNA primase [Bacillota bacterium]
MAMRYPPEWIDDLRARADIASIVSEYVPLRQNGRSFKGLCPFHQEKTPSFHVDPDKGLYYCFGCKAGGSVIQFIMAAERMEFSEAVRFLADKLHVPLPARSDDAEAEKKRTLRETIYELNRKAARIFHDTLYAPEGAGILDYLHGRGLDDPVIHRFGLGAAPAGWDTLTGRLLEGGASAGDLVSAGLTVEKNGKRFDMFRNRAMFPIISAHGAVLGFGGRAMGDSQPKYLNTSDTPAFNKGLNVYGQNLLRKARNLQRVLLVEGYMDVVSLTRHGVEGVAATLGTALTPEQAKLLKRYAPAVWVAYDGDKAGQTAALRALEVFHALDIPAHVLSFPDGLDPDEFIRGRGREAFEALRPLSAPQYQIERAADGLDLSAEEGRTQYAIACAAILRTVRQPVEAENLLKRLVVATG